MGLFSTLLGNPAVEILEERLWETARKRYLGQHPSDAEEDAQSISQRVRSAYKDEVAATLREADHKVRAHWGEFKHIMTEELRVALATVLRMSELEWYAVEVGQLPYPAVIAAPYELLRRMTTEVMREFVRKLVDFEDLEDAVLEALASYAADRRFQRILEDARRNYELFEIGNRSTQFVVTEIIRRDAYFVGEDDHHSLIDVVVLGSVGKGCSDQDKTKQKNAVKKWMEQDRKCRKNDRRFTGDGWDIEPEELKFWATGP